VSKKFYTAEYGCDQSFSDKRLIDNMILEPEISNIDNLIRKIIDYTYSDDDFLNR